MKRLGIAVLSLVALAGAIGNASAQDRATIVTVCGTPVSTYSAADVQALTMDTGGKLCVNATVSASVTVAPLTSTRLSSAISVTNTFQSIQVSTAGRNGCLIENQSTTNTMWVFFGPIGSATKGGSVILDTAHGLAVSCAVGGLGVVIDQISITGTSADSYFANVQ